MYPSPEHAHLAPGMPVEVRCRFDDGWVGGFVVAEIRPEAEPVAVTIRRAGAGDVLPESFRATEIRPVA